MARSKQARIDEELDEAVEKIMELGDFNTKTDASRKAGEILNEGLNQMFGGMKKEMKVEFENEEEVEDDFFTATGVDHSMLGFEE